MTVYLMWAIVLLLLGLALVILEAFIPSGGILGALAVIAVLVSVGMAFSSSAAHGGILLLCALVAVPGVIALAIKWWPNTPIGKRILLGVPTAEDVLPDSPKRRGLRELVGQVGQARSVMLPSGPVLIDGKIVDAVSEGMAIEKGQTVRVVEVRGSRVVVRPDDAAVPDRKTASEAQDDLLSRPIDSIGSDPFGDTSAS